MLGCCIIQARRQFNLRYQFLSRPNKIKAIACAEICVSKTGVTPDQVLFLDDLNGDLEFPIGEDQEGKVRILTAQELSR